MILARALSMVGRISPLFSLALNRLRFPGVRAGILAELPAKGSLVHGKGVIVGALSRIYVGPRGRVGLGEAVMLGRNVHLQTGGGRIEIGNRTSVQDNCRLYGDISLGEGCILAPNIYASSGNHLFDYEPYLPIALQETIGPQENRPIGIGDDCWIGVNAVIMGGVSIGNGAIIGAGAVVTRDVPPYGIAVGVPARTIGKRLDFTPPAAINARRAQDWPYFYSGFQKSVTALEMGAGLAVEGRFVLALVNDKAQTLLIRGQAGPQGKSISFNRQTRSIESGEARFDLPPMPRSTDRLELMTSGRLVIASAELT
jgi:acetyltransferase-like isoleucine patch superfamily enzyme